MQRRRAAAADPLVGRPAAGRQAQWPPRPYTDIMILENKKSKWGRQGPGRALCQRHHRVIPGAASHGASHAGCRPGPGMEAALPRTRDSGPGPTAGADSPL